MAKRKRLNKRVLALLISLGIILILGGVGVVLRFLPKDPAAYAQKGEEALAKGEWKKAEDMFKIARNASTEAKYSQRLARFLLDRIGKDPSLTPAERRDRHRGAIGLLKEATMRDPTATDAQELLCDIYWGALLGSSGEGQEYLLDQLVDETTSLLKLKPEDDQTYARRAVCYARKARTVPSEATIKAAENDFRKAIEIKKDNPAYWLELIRFLSDPQINRRNEAMQVFVEAIAAMPNNADLRVEYAHMLNAEGRSADAMREIQAAIDNDQKNPRGYLALAAEYQKANQIDQALEALNRAIQVDDTDVRAYRQIAMIHTLKKQYPEALAALRKGLSVVEEYRKNLSTTQPAAQNSRLALAQYELNYLLAKVLLDMQFATSDEKAKADLLAQAKTHLSEMEKIPAEEGLKDQIRGRIAIAENKADEAIRLLEKALEEIRGFDIQTASYLVSLYRAVTPARPGDALKLCRQIAAQPGLADNVEVRLLAARLEWDFGRQDQALALIDEVLRIDPGNADALNLRKLLRVTQTDTVSIPADVTLTPEAERRLLQQVAVWVADGQGAKALQLAENLYRRAPKNPTVVATLVNLYQQTNQIDKAKTVLRRAIADIPDSKENLEFQMKLLDAAPDARFQMLADEIGKTVTDKLSKALNLADLCATFGRLEEYKKNLAEAAAIDPNAPGVVERQFRLALAEKNWTMADTIVRAAAQANLDGVKGMFYSARLAMARNDYAQAIKDLTAILDTNPRSREARLMQSEAYLERKEKGDLDKAEAILEALWGSNPSDQAAVVLLARVKEAMGKWNEQRDLVSQAYKIGSRHPYIVRWYLMIRQLAGDESELGDLIRRREQLLASEPDNLSNVVLLARLYERTKNPRAEEMYKLVYDRAEDKVVAASEVVGYYLRTNQSTKADALLNELIPSTTDKAGAYALYANMLARLNQPEQALAMIDKAIQADPKDHRGYATKADLQAARGDWAGAADALAKYLEIRPDDVIARRNLVEFRFRAGQLDQAEAALRPLQATESTNKETLVLTGMIAMARQDQRKAEQLFTQALQDDPKFIRALRERAALYVGLGEIFKAKNDMETVLRVEREQVSEAAAVGGAEAEQQALRTRVAPASVQLAELQAQLGQYDEAERLCQDALKIVTNYPPAMRVLTSIHVSRKNWAALEKLLSDARKAIPEDPQVPIYEADMWRARQQPDRRLAALTEALKLNKDSTSLKREFLDALADAGRYDDVLKLAEEYEKDPELKSAAGVFRARALAGQGKTAEADAQFQASLKDETVPAAAIVEQLRRAYGADAATARLTDWLPKFRANDPRAYVAVADLLNERDNQAAMKQVVDLLTRAKELIPAEASRSAVNQRLGMACYRLGEYGAAEKAYLDVLKELPNDLHALNNLAYMYTNEMKRPNEGLPYAEKAARLRPSDANVQDTYGWTLAQTAQKNPARWGEAQVALERSVAIEPLAANCYHLGWVYEQRGRTADAARQYRRGLNLIQGKPADPLYKELSDGLKRVQ